MGVCVLGFLCRLFGGGTPFRDFRASNDWHTPHCSLGYGTDTLFQGCDYIEVSMQLFHRTEDVAHCFAW